MKNNDKLKKLVDNMMKEPNHNPRDYCFRFIVSKYPKASHKVFNFPGTFIKSLPTAVFTDRGRNLEMDSAQLVEAGGFINRKSTINVEHQTYKITDEKVDSIYDFEPPRPKRAKIPGFFSLNGLIKYFPGYPRWTSGLTIIFIVIC